jgi:hypothetical protein
VPSSALARPVFFDDDCSMSSEDGEELERRSGDAGVARGPGPDAFRGVSRLERAILPFLREPTLWPVLLVIVGHAIVVLAPLLIFAWRDGSSGALTSLVLLAGLSIAAGGSELRARRRLGAIGGLAAVTWSLSAIAAWLAARAEIL